MSGMAGAAEPADASARARGSSFNAAMRILPRPRREAMFEIYSFCRAVDDIADEAAPRHARRQALAKWRRDIGALYTGGNEQTSAPPRLRGLAVAIRAFGLRREDFFAVIDGMEMDVEADISAPDLATLDLYCDRVAGAVGRLSARAFGMPQQEGHGLAHHLGRALQLTNILRDLDEDAALGRLYLPREDLRAAGIIEAEPREVLANPALALACAPTIAHAKEHFAEASRIMARCPRASVRAPRIMADVYRAILACLERRGFAAPRKRVRTPRHRVVIALLRYGLL
ncbi:MAG: presqualene diphosphate synthase HpnD [Methylocella sp.]